MKSLPPGTEAALKNLVAGHLSIRVVDLVAALDVSALVATVRHKHPTHSKEAWFKLAVYQRVHGLPTYPALRAKLGHEIVRFGFAAWPSKRAYNDVRHKLPATLILDLAELILKTATQAGVLLDLDVVTQTVAKRRTEVARYQPELQATLRLLKRLVYPQVDLKIGRNAHFTTRDLLDVLVHVATTHDFCANGSKTFRACHPERRTPHGDTLLYHLHKLDDNNDIQALFTHVFDLLFKLARREYPLLTRRPLNLALDVHKIPYFGVSSTPYVCGGKQDRGTAQFFEFVTCSIVVPGHRFVLGALPKHPLDRLDTLVEKLLRAAKQKVRIDTVFVDRGFDTARIINVFQRLRLRFLMPKVRSETVKAWMDKAEGAPVRIIPDFTFGTTEKATATLFFVDDQDGVKRAFLTNLRVAPPLAAHLAESYRARWGIEVSYRLAAQDARLRTTSTAYPLRLFYFLFSLCLYNLWVLTNLVLDLMRHRRLSEKPTLTFKLFLTLVIQAAPDIH